MGASWGDWHRKDAKAIADYYEKHGSGATKRRFSCNSVTIRKAVYENGGVLKSEKERSLEDLVPCVLVLEKIELPLHIATKPYMYDGETVVDLVGLAGVHRAVPVSSIRT